MARGAVVDPGPPLEVLPEPQARRRRWLALLPLAMLAFVLYALPLPYFLFSPGPARDVQPLIEVNDHPVYPSRGQLLLTSIYFQRATAVDAVEAWIDPAKTLVPEGAVLAPGETVEEEAEAARSEMDTSKIDAAVVALIETTDYPDDHGPGALVERVFAGTPAEGKLFAGDVIVAAAGRRVADPDALGRAIADAGAGNPLRLTVQAGGETRRVVVRPTTLPERADPIIGITSVHNFPFEVTIRSGDIGGPSAGLMWTLGLIEKLTPGDLTGGRKVAGTGAIDAEGIVTEIGGVEEKVVAAERAGAEIFFAPPGNVEAARAVADEITVVPVRTYRDALEYLERES